MFWLKSRRRRRIRRRPFPPGWLDIVERNVPYYHSLSPPDRSELLGDILVFLDEKRFEGCGGLQLDDEIRVTIAAQACVLLLHRRNDDYPHLQSILVYPHAYVAKGKRSGTDGIVCEGDELRGGESWRSGAVVLAWDHVRKKAADVHDGHNVVLHEFAHQLDQESGAADGAPLLPRRSMYVAWARVLGHEYRRLLEDIERHRPTVIDKYGGTNPAEFFAVVTECFFDDPVRLRRKHPQLYEELRLFYRQDPATSVGGGGKEAASPGQDSGPSS